MLLSNIEYQGRIREGLMRGVYSVRDARFLFEPVFGFCRLSFQLFYYNICTLLCKICPKNRTKFASSQLFLKYNVTPFKFWKRRSKFWPLGQRWHLERGCNSDRKHLGNLARNFEQKSILVSNFYGVDWTRRWRWWCIFLSLWLLTIHHKFPKIPIGM